MKYLITNMVNVSSPAAWPVPTKIQKIGELHILQEGDKNTEYIDGNLLLCDGYMRDLNMKVGDVKGQKKSVINAIGKAWPLAPNITGSFSATLIKSNELEIILCTDQVGLYPLYYLQNEKFFFISNSIIMLGAVSGGDFDEAGIIQRSLGPDYATLGSRTILKDCKRLLPGELLKWNFKGEQLKQEFDNRLFQQMQEPNKNNSRVKEYWLAYKREVEYCVNYSGKVNVALSGGIDSRIVLGAIPAGKEIDCYTYGDTDNYETQIAEKLCRLKKGTFHACSNPDLYFPNPETFRKKVIETEAMELCSWLEITESIKEKKEEPLLLGELCEALPGRNIKSFSSKEFRKKNFLRYFIRKKDYCFTKADEINFAQWKAKIIHQFKIYYHERNIKKFEYKVENEKLLEELLLNLEELFNRIEAHQLPYAELYDELFSWYTFTRIHLAKHLLVANSKFHAYSPAMSLQMLTLTSRIHPNQRLNYRFAKELFRKNEELQKLSKVPTAQAPLIPQNFPDLLKFAMWGIRSTVDQYLIRRMMKKKNPEIRYRLFKSINWAQVYHHPQMDKNLRDYFEPNEIGSLFFEDLFKQAVDRKELKQWPFANLNIINAASLNVEVNSIKNFRNTNAV